MSSWCANNQTHMSSQLSMVESLEETEEQLIAARESQSIILHRPQFKNSLQFPLIISWAAATQSYQHTSSQTTDGVLISGPDLTTVNCFVAATGYNSATSPATDPTNNGTALPCKFCSCCSSSSSQAADGQSLAIEFQELVQVGRAASNLLVRAATVRLIESSSPSGPGWADSG